MLRLLIYIAFGFVLLSCNFNTALPENEMIAFDIPGWLNEGSHLNSVSSDIQIKKTVSMDEIAESKFITLAEFDSSLQMLAELDLNTSRYEGKLLTDTTRFSDSTFSIHYTIYSNRLPVKSAEIQFLNAEVTSLQLFTEENNMLYNIQKEYKYQPGKSFTITVDQKTIFYGEKHYSLRYDILQ
ncbi:MAG: hypothetical protein IPL48_04515 [Bacteroidetes bacterium]|nr:hypothetical protein [Bacteroidota bacterium]